jgi:hypothetical protein
MALEDLLNRLQDRRRMVARAAITGRMPQDMPAQQARKMESIAIGKLLDARKNLDDKIDLEKLKLANKAYLDLSDKLINAYAKIESAAVSARGAKQVSQLKRLTEIDNEMFGDLPTTVTNTIAKLKKGVGVGRPNVKASDKMLVQALEQAIPSVQASGSDNIRPFLRIVAAELSEPLDVETLEAQLLAQAPADGDLAKMIALGRQEESRQGSRENERQLERINLLNDLRRGAGSGSVIFKYFQSGGNPVAAFAKNPQLVQQLHDETVDPDAPAGGFEVQARQKFLAGDLPTLYREVLNDKDFRELATGLGIPRSKWGTFVDRLSGAGNVEAFLEKHADPKKRREFQRREQGVPRKEAPKREGISDKEFFEMLDEGKGPGRRISESTRLIDVNTLRRGVFRASQEKYGTDPERWPDEIMSQFKRLFREQKELRELLPEGDMAEIEYLNKAIEFFDKAKPVIADRFKPTKKRPSLSIPRPTEAIEPQKPQARPQVSRKFLTGDALEQWREQIDPRTGKFFEAADAPKIKMQGPGVSNVPVEGAVEEIKTTGYTTPASSFAEPQREIMSARLRELEKKIAERRKNKIGAKLASNRGIGK